MPWFRGTNTCFSICRFIFVLFVVLLWWHKTTNQSLKVTWNLPILHIDKHGASQSMFTSLTSFENLISIILMHVICHYKSDEQNRFIFSLIDLLLQHNKNWNWLLCSSCTSSVDSNGVNQVLICDTENIILTLSLGCYGSCFKTSSRFKGV